MSAGHYAAKACAAAVLLVAAAAIVAGEILPADGQAVETAIDAPVPRSQLLGHLADPTTLVLIDARSPDEFAAAHVNRAINIPHDQAARYAGLLPGSFDAPIVIYCRTGQRSRQLPDLLIDRGYSNVRVLRPEQLFWSADMAVFNCGAGADAREGLPAMNREDRRTP